MKTYTCELCGKESPNKECNECNQNEDNMKNHTPTSLDKVVIMQKYNDSNEVLKCKQEFERAEKDIINAVNSHQLLINSIEEALRYFREHNIDHNIVRLLKVNLSKAGE